MPRCSLYHRAITVGSFARKKTPPIPVTLCMHSFVGYYTSTLSARIRVSLFHSLRSFHHPFRVRLGRSLVTPASSLAPLSAARTEVEVSVVSAKFVSLILGNDTYR